MIDQFQPDLSTEFVATVDDAGLSTIASIARAVLCARTDPIAAKFKEALERAPLHAVEGIEADLGRVHCGEPVYRDSRTSGIHQRTRAASFLRRHLPATQLCRVMRD